MKSINLPPLVIFLLSRMSQAGYSAYVVGGAVRDSLLSRPNVVDWDITTNATPQQLLDLIPESFCDNNYGTVMVAPKHVATLAFEELGLSVPEDSHSDLEVFDVTTYRNEAGYSNRRHPDKVDWGKSLEEDVTRRDFTINALALSPQVDLSTFDLNNYFTKPEPLEVRILDFHHGLEDIEARLVRAVGDPNQRFGEDALRMMRAIRLATQLSFMLEPSTLEAITLNAHLISHISFERKRDELLKILASDYPADGVQLLYTTGLLSEIIPELTEAVDVPQGGRHKYDVWRHSLESLRECPSTNPIVRLATLLHDVGKPRTIEFQGPRGVTFYGHEVVGAHMAKKIADRLRLSSKDKQKIFTLVRWHMFHYDPAMTDSAIKRLIRRIGVENINDMINLRIGDRLGGGSRASSWRLRELQERIGENLYEPLGLKDLAINGHDLMNAFGLKPGPILGTVLNQLFEEVMEETVPNTKEALLARSKELIE